MAIGKKSRRGSGSNRKPGVNNIDRSNYNGGVHHACFRDRNLEAVDATIARINAKLDHEAQHGPVRVIYQAPRQYWPSGD